jgi:hypothetical protein
MGKGLSRLQKNILAVLDQWPSFEQATDTRPDSVADWAWPRDIIRVPRTITILLLEIPPL